MTRRPDSQLVSLERLRTMELEQARSEQASLEKLEAQRRAIVAQARARFEETQDFARASLAASGPLSADALLRVAAFSRLQAQQIEEAKAAWEEARRTTELAHERVVQRRKSLSIVERLRERRAQVARLEAARLEQRRLDEHALSRLAVKPDIDGSTKRKDGHGH